MTQPWIHLDQQISVERLIDVIGRDRRVGEVLVKSTTQWVWTRHAGDESEEIRYGTDVELSVVADGAGWGGPVFEGIEVGREFVIANLLLDRDAITNYVLDGHQPYDLVKVIADAIASFQP